eukprot:CAMPEP_0194748302 /NCGR_PEP_ID=MMETSP0323_2-20130528/2449_1 /TAXON_ID=2866 ORGANISM="Crypthecodinium cohnii, Strain Seligo" /NCGR_SAMPLE_ID=MMETSP0323_2 /ASSEMBLY_ACC=CAM_ASM_000346 /LENGTH=197 /DNA_ID=CAMNT_0039662433 /DNA_START=350 /DNA_END=943 /DNA_ORIENTATION=+
MPLGLQLASAVYSNLQLFCLLLTQGLGHHLQRPKKSSSASRGHEAVSHDPAWRTTRPQVQGLARPLPVGVSEHIHEWLYARGLMAPEALGEDVALRVHDATVGRFGDANFPEERCQDEKSLCHQVGECVEELADKATTFDHGLQGKPHFSNKQTAQDDFLIVLEMFSLAALTHPEASIPNSNRHVVAQTFHSVVYVA